jgi:hypothetical protein
MGVVRQETRRRWIAVGVVLTALLALPVVIAVWPVQAATIPPTALRDRIRASESQAFSGYAQTIGTLPIPELPRLADVTSLLSTTTELRTWYVAPDRWRVDQIGPGNETGLYHRPEGEYRWDYTDEQLTRIVGDQAVRLPRAADLIPPDLGRRLVDATRSDPVSALPARRIAGVPAAGLRIVPADPSTTIAHIDLWVVAGTGLPLQVEVVAKNVSRPVLTSRFLEIDQHAPSAGVITPPQPHPGIGFTTTQTPDLISAINRFGGSGVVLPPTLAGKTRRTAVDGVSAAAAYGSGLTELIVLAAPGRLGRDAYDQVNKFGQAVDYAGTGAQATIISTSLLSVLVVRNPRLRRTFLLAGLVDPAVLRAAGAQLAGAQ